MCQFRHFGDLIYKLLMEKLQLCALMPFMLYMPYSVLFVQENTSKYQILPKFTRNSPLANLLQEAFAISEVLAKSRSRRPEFCHQRESSSEVSPSTKFPTNFRKVKWIRDTWSNSIGAEADFIHFANSEIFGYQRNFTDLAHINSFFFSFF